MKYVRLPTLLVLGLLTIVSSTRPSSASGTTARVEVPISQTMLPNGEIRYSVPVSVGGGAPIKAMLDTGSFGLRVMAKALSSSRYEETGVVRAYRYESGVEFRGPLIKAVVSVGDATTATPIVMQLIEMVDCAPNKPNCPASKVDQSDYGIGGNGVPREGFSAILGLSLHKPSISLAALNPLSELGHQTWIIILPLPGERGPGKLIVNPNQADQVGFQLIPFPGERAGESTNGGFINGSGRGAALDNRIPICPDGSAIQGSCPPVKLDSGARDGLEPFYVYAVLFDQTRRMIGVKPRRELQR
jgi:hypothetical protein